MLTYVSIGKIMATNGWSLTVNANFAQQAIFLAQQLTWSKTCIASLHVIMSRHPNISLVSSIKVIIVEFHQQRRHLVNCLHSPPRTSAPASPAHVPFMSQGFRQAGACPRNKVCRR